jgi:5-methyltetrahydrofolate--homocysteine methyltransferase
LTQKEPFLEAMKNRVLLFDGAMGTEIQKFNPKPEDFPNNQDGFNDGLVLTHPEWIKQIHRNYLDAGADCIETNSFGSNKIKLDEYGFGDQTVEFNKKISQLASEVCSEYSDKPRYVIGSMGPASRRTNPWRSGCTTN